MRDFRNGPFPSANLTIAFSSLDQIRCNPVVITGLVFRRSLYVLAAEWHREHVNALRQLRRDAHLSQQECADLLAVPLNTFRMWDSGLRPTPCGVLERVDVAVRQHTRDSELCSLDQLAREFGVHERTLRAAARSGRLVVQFSTRSAFGRPIRRTTRKAVAEFVGRYYKRCYSRFARRPLPPTMDVPADYARRLRCIRRQLGLRQQQLAAKIRAARKAVVYQWESGKRRPSPVFWQRIQDLRADARR
jgi:DNA-binding transcriptional regulator YiaG